MTNRDDLRDVVETLTECVQEHKRWLDDAASYIAEDVNHAEWGDVADHATDAIHHHAMFHAYEHALNLVQQLSTDGGVSDE